MSRVIITTTILMLSIVKPSFQDCTEFVEISADDYDRTYHTISEGDSGARPLGFLKDTLVYQGNGSPCYSVTGVVGQQVEIKFETVPTMLLCVKVEGTDFERCTEPRLTDCVTLSQETANFEFFCDVARGCAEGDVNFWLRITKGPTPEEDTEGMWCHNLSEDYPESLRPLPSGLFTPTPTSPIGGSTVLTVSSLSMILLLSASLFVQFLI